MTKPKVAIYDFTDCEGCEVEIVSLRDKILALENRLDIINWRLGQENNQNGPFDITLIEGTPITKHEIELLEKLRDESKVLVALGACAAVGGIPGIMDKKDRQKWYKKIYGKNYKPRGIDSLPLSAYVNVDFCIHGCPVTKEEVLRIVEELLSGKKPSYRGYSVCFECKQANNSCRIIDGKPCLGPVTQGGCNAVCVSGGSSCYGCFGFRDEANVKGMVKALKSKDLKRSTVYPLIKQYIQPESTVYTDEFHTYDALDKQGYKHQSVNHGTEQWVNGKAHTNTIEGFWSLLKRGINGVYHAVGEKYLQNYINEYAFRYNHRNDDKPMFKTVLERI